MMLGRQFISYALSIGAITFPEGGVKLKNGRISPYFFRSDLYYTGETLNQFARGYAEVIAHQFVPLPDVNFGLSYKGSAIAVASTMILGDKIAYAYDRKEEKDHGEGGSIVGAPLKGKSVVLVDDVMTTGDSLDGAVRIVENAKGKVVGCVIAFDRQEKGRESNFSAVQEFTRRHKIPTYSVANLDNLIETLELAGDRYSVLVDLKNYKAQWGV